MSLADAMKDMEEFRAANRELAAATSGERRLETRPSNTRPERSLPPEVTHTQRVEPLGSYRISASATPPPWKHRSSSPSSSTWGKSDPESKRQRRVVRYKYYGYERKMKDSVMGGFRWMKNKYCEIVYGY